LNHIGISLRESFKPQTHETRSACAEAMRKNLTFSFVCACALLRFNCFSFKGFVGCMPSGPSDRRKIDCHLVRHICDDCGNLLLVLGAKDSCRQIDSSTFGSLVVTRACILFCCIVLVFGLAACYSWRCCVRRYARAGHRFRGSRPQQRRVG